MLMAIPIKQKKETEPLGRKSVKHKIRQTNTQRKRNDDTSMTYHNCFTSFVLSFNIELHTNNEHEKN
jgi:hypothetical protein